MNKNLITGSCGLVGIILIINNEIFSLEKKTVTIASPRIISALLPVAVEKVFDKYGIDVKLLPTQTEMAKGGCW